MSELNVKKIESPTNGRLLLVCNSKGQVAVFVALIFQVLFVFFAMVVNVGLFVHHKINLQNSVDLAAYYGAMKQAEVLNTIAHVNYQIRQSWKLQVFRYRHLGMAGDEDFHPYIHTPPGSARTAIDDVPWPADAGFCFAYSPIDFVDSTDNFCQKMNFDAGTGQMRRINLPMNAVRVNTNFLVDSILGGIQSTLDSIQNTHRVLAQEICKKVMQLNFFTIAMFIVAHKKDVANRKRLIFKLGNLLSASEDDFKDLDGASARAGALETFKRNLTPQNAKGHAEAKFEFFNSMGHQECKSGNSDLEPPTWLSEINILPLYAVMDGDCGSSVGDEINFAVKFINSGDPTQSQPDYRNNMNPTVANALTELMTYVQEPSGANPLTRLFKTTIGYEKDPWCVSYVRVKAEAHPKIPFMPLGSDTLNPYVMRAQAFAKPFGGTIGPWDRKGWSRNSRQSDGTAEVDIARPPRIDPSLTSFMATDPRYRGDYSRYVGDAIGSQSTLSVYRMAKELFERHFPGKIQFGFWGHLYEGNLLHFDDPTNHGDMLAWDNLNDKPGEPMRNLELSAIAPDGFDAAYYSIEPDYYRNHLVRLKKRQAEFGFAVRGDLGSRNTAPDAAIQRFSVRDQIFSTESRSGTKDKRSFFLSDPFALNYFVQDWSSLLTSYQSKSPEEPVIDLNRFGKCSVRIFADDDDVNATSGNCVGGGRSGYSVKLVHGEYLRRNDLQLGGEGTSGAIRNPW